MGVGVHGESGRMRLYREGTVLYSTYVYTQQGVDKVAQRAEDVQAGVDPGATDTEPPFSKRVCLSASNIFSHWFCANPVEFRHVEHTTAELSPRAPCLLRSPRMAHGNGTSIITLYVPVACRRFAALEATPVGETGKFGGPWHPPATQASPQSKHVSE